MGTYAHVIYEAFFAFPLVALLITLPYIVYNYHRFGSALGLKTLIFYSFVLYMLCVGFLVIMPLPSFEEVRALTTPRYRLEPFGFVGDLLRTIPGSWSDLSTWKRALTSSIFLQVFFNVCMTLPFGMYLRYYFRRNLWQTVLLGFALSLFIELTQLTGLWFIYPRGYRFFEVDDLIANTLGTFLGYVVTGPLLRILPTRDLLDTASYRRGQSVSLTRRLTALGIDLAVVLLLAFIVHLAVRQVPGYRVLAGILCAYFLLVPTLTGGSSVGKAVTRLRIVGPFGQPAHWYQLIGRSALLLTVFVGLPVALHYGAYPLASRIDGSPLVFPTAQGILVGGFYLFLALFLCLGAAAHRPLFYERLTKTQVLNTLLQGRPI